MSGERGADSTRGTRYTPGGAEASERVPRRRNPMRPWAFVRLHRSLVATGLLLLLGFVVQVIVMVLVYQLVDLTLDLMEVWAELARKHLEIQLS